MTPAIEQLVHETMELTGAERPALLALAEKTIDKPAFVMPSRPFVKNWTVADLDPVLDGTKANGVRVNSNGELSWLVGNLGDIPVVRLDYKTYSAVGWTIEASEEGTRFTNDDTGHGMVIAVEGVQAF